MTLEAEVMEVKKPLQVASAKEKASKRWSALFDFIGNVKGEFAKITWTDKDELRLYTKLVVGATFLFGLGIYCVDLVIQSALGLLGTIFHFIFG